MALCLFLAPWREFSLRDLEAGGTKPQWRASLSSLKFYANCLAVSSASGAQQLCFPLCLWISDPGTAQRKSRWVTGVDLLGSLVQGTKPQVFIPHWEARRGALMIWSSSAQVSNMQTWKHFGDAARFLELWRKWEWFLLFAIGAPSKPMSCWVNFFCVPRALNLKYTLALVVISSK